jgi:hypothetical protein
MKNKRFIILISIAAITIVGLFGFMFYYSLIKGPGEGTPTNPIELTNFGSSAPVEQQPSTGISNTLITPEPTPAATAPISLHNLRKISETPVVGAVSFEKERAIENAAPLTFSFENDLKLNDTNKEVRSLQIFLNSIIDSINTTLPQVGPIAKTGPASFGKEGTFFGPATKEALIRFQNKYPEEILTPAGLKTGDGVFAGATREKANSLLAGAPGVLVSKLTGAQKQTETATALRYVDRLAGNVYETYIDNIKEKRVSNTPIFGIQDAVFGNQGQSVVMRYLKTDGSTIETFLGNIKNEVLGGDSPIELKGYFLPENVLGASASPDGKNMFYIFKSSGGVVGINSALESGKNTQIFDSSFSEWLVEWPNQRSITLATKPSYVADGYLYSLDPTGGPLHKLLGNIKGLMSKVSPDGRLVLYAGGDLSLKTFSSTEKTINDLGLKTLPEKCVWSTDNINIYCAIPKDIPGGNFPDSWYQGEVQFDDALWKINTKTNSNTLLSDPGSSVGESIDGTDLFLDQKENNLFIINKKDSTLWALGPVV